MPRPRFSGRARRCRCLPCRRMPTAIRGRTFSCAEAKARPYESRGYRGEKSLEEEELRNELGKPLNAIQWVQVPPDQSRADRSVASLAIHRVTGGCEALSSLL